MEIKAKKSLGQNFLIDETVLDDIVSAINPQKGETIVEIGPGHGELTKQLIAYGLELLGKNAIKVIVIEKDHRLINGLKLLGINVVEGDALKDLPDVINNYKLKAISYKLVGNIPYYITGHLFRIVSELKNKPSEMVFMIQKEVAERICAKEGEMNILAASIQVWAKPEIIRFVPKEAFSPKPKVDSAVIRLKTINSPYFAKATKGKSNLTKLDLKKYYELLHIVFKQPRKTLFNNLRSGGIAENKIKEIFYKLGIEVKSRPQDMGIEKLAKIAKIF